MGKWRELQEEDSKSSGDFGDESGQIRKLMGLDSVELCSQKCCVESSHSQYLMECDFIWASDIVGTTSQVKAKSYCIKVDPNPM